MKRFFRKNRKGSSTDLLLATLEESTPSESQKKSKRIGLALITGLFAGFVVAAGCFLFAPTLRDYVFWVLPAHATVIIDEQADTTAFDKEIKNIERRIIALKKRIDALIPREPYLVIDTSGNFFYIKKYREVVHKGICSTGSYVLLRAANNRQWIFRTPRGQFRVLSRLYAPVWYMPDWAFVEEGRPIPPRDSPERFEPGVLGEYALAIGRGYLIHGTLYKRMLGMPVTHGCIRLGDEDLRAVWKNSHNGTLVLIY